MNKNKFIGKKASAVLSALLIAGMLSGCTALSSEKKNAAEKNVKSSETVESDKKAGAGNKQADTSWEASPSETKPANISPEEAKKRLDNEKGIILLDVRTQEEFDSGHIKDSILIPVDMLKDSAERKLKDKNSVIFVYCRSGNRSTTAAKILAELGYKKVFNLGGINKWPYDIEK